MTKFLITLIILINLITLAPFGSAQAETDMEVLAKNLREQINNLQLQIIKMQEELTSATEKLTELEVVIKFNKDLRSGAESEDVRNLQKFLSQYPDIYPEAKVTGFFGPMTSNAIKRFQEKYADDILKPYGLASGTGYVGPATRAKLNELAKGATPAIPAVPATPAVPAEAPAVPAIPAQPATTTPQATSNQQLATSTPDTTALANVSNLTLTAGESMITVSWKNPADSDFAGTMVIRKDWSSPTSIIDGVQIYNGLATTTINRGIINGISYCYKAFAYDRILNYSSGTGLCATPTSTAIVTITTSTPVTVQTTPVPTPIPAPTQTPTLTPTVTPAPAQTTTTTTATTTIATTDTTPPGNAMNLTATAGNNSQVTLSWTNPTDSDFAGTKILRKTDTYPTSASDGTQVYSGPGTIYIDTGLTNGITYHYRAYAFDAIPNYSPGSDVVTATPVAPSSLSIVGAAYDSLYLLEFPWAVAVSGNYAYVTVTGAGSNLVVIDISNPAFPAIVGNVQDTAKLHGGTSIKVSGNYAYVTASNNNRLTIVNVSNKNSPVVAGSVYDATALDKPWALDISGNYAYVAVFNSSKLAIVDISNPASPSVVGSVGGISGAYAVDVVGNYAYVLGVNSKTLYVVDVSNPAAPSIVGSVLNSSRFDGANNISVVGNYAYVTAYASDNLVIVDISNPASPSIAGYVQDVSVLDGAYSVAVSGNYAYVAAAFSNRLVVVDISNPASPAIVNSIQDPTLLYNPTSVAVSGNYAYVVARYGGRLTIVDISRPVAFIESLLKGIQSKLASISAAVLGLLKR